MNKKLIPNALSFFRILISPVLAYLIIWQDTRLDLLLPLLFITALTDYLDGWAARQLRVTSNTGTFLDPLADKICIITIFASLAVIDLVSWWAVGAIAARDLIITGLRIHFITRKQTLNTVYIAKFKTVLQGCALIAILCIAQAAPASRYLIAPIVWSVVAFTWYTAGIYLLRNRAILHHITQGICIGIAQVGLLGLSPHGPGTLTSTCTMLVVFYLKLPSLVLLSATVATMLVGYCACHALLNGAADADPSWIVIDEVIGMMIALLWVPHTTTWYLAAFLLFRVFDISKACGISWFERLPGAAGIVLDDVVAGAYTAGILCVAKMALLLV